MKHSNIPLLATVALCAIGIMLGILGGFYLAGQFPEDRAVETTEILPYKFPEPQPPTR